jgi:hypothetical protein
MSLPSPLALLLAQMHQATQNQQARLAELASDHKLIGETEVSTSQTNEKEDASEAVPQQARKTRTRGRGRRKAIRKQWPK